MRTGTLTSALLLMAAGCGSNTAPEVVSMTATPRYCRPGGSLAIVASAFDEDGGALEYAWSAGAGSIVACDPGEATWTAPAESAGCDVVVVVTDAAGASDTASIEVGCGPNVPPVIEAVTVQSNPVRFPRACTLMVGAWDPEGGPMRFLWRGPGQFYDSTSAAVVWQSPVGARTYELTVAVADTEGAAATDTFAVTVLADSVMVIDTSLTVAGYRYTDLARFCDRAPLYQTWGEFSADGGGITFLVLDDANFARWSSGSPYSALVFIPDATWGSFGLDAPAGTYHFVMDNSGSSAAKGVQLRVVRVSQNP